MQKKSETERKIWGRSTVQKTSPEGSIKLFESCDHFLSLVFPFIERVCDVEAIPVNLFSPERVFITEGRQSRGGQTGGIYMYTPTDKHAGLAFLCWYDIIEIKLAPIADEILFKLEYDL